MNPLFTYQVLTYDVHMYNEVALSENELNGQKVKK